MSEDFGLSSDDEADLRAAMDDAMNGKRSHDTEHHQASEHVPKRARIGDVTDRSNSPSAILANKILKQRFGLDGFRLEQEAAIARILDGGSAVVVFPTGGGKSLCYQVSIVGQRRHVHF
jgi:superfamily II DNA helicase RecQ